MERRILHIDMNNFYASVECILHPESLGRVVVVCGDVDNRHGVVLAKNALAKALGIKTGMVLWEARAKCDDLVVFNARFSLYLEYSRAIKKIFSEYTDLIESFGIDECWLDVTNCAKLYGTAQHMADIISRRIKNELSLTVSIGISYNKIYAKIGSDIAGNDEIVEITRSNRADTVFPLPVSDLLYVGKATKKKLNKLNIFTIGELAAADKTVLKSMLGKWGEYLYNFANGVDLNGVSPVDSVRIFKSVGNSLTNYKDIISDTDISALINVLAEGVVSRMRELRVTHAHTISVSVKNAVLESYRFRQSLPSQPVTANSIYKTAYSMVMQRYNYRYPVRAIGIILSGFSTPNEEQLSVFADKSKLHKEIAVENAVSKIKRKYGNTIITRAIVMTDKNLAKLDLVGEHVIHPESYF